VNAAQVMAVFLRTWREEWAGLSRAQLALAVSAQCESSSGKRIAPDVVRKWERGQPPETAEELAALTLVMRRHGLQASEVEQFRQAAFAACVARQYPGLFQEEDLAYRSDLADMAQTMFVRYWDTPGAASIVQLTANVRHLEQATQGELRPSASREETRRQQSALCHLRALLADAHGYAGRFRAAAEVLAANADALEAWFGPRGLGFPLSPLAQRGVEAYVRYALARPRGWVRPDPASAGWGLRLVALSEEAEVRGEERATRQAFFYALHALSENRHPAHEMCRARAPDIMAKAEDAGDQTVVENGRLQLFRAAEHDGLPDEAERHLGALEYMKDADPLRQVVWHECMGSFALKVGHLDEAQSQLEGGLLVARKAKGFATWEGAFVRHLRTCEGRPKPAAPARAR